MAKLSDVNKPKIFVMDNCDDCIYKINGEYQIVCFECKRYYADMFEKKVKK